MKRLIRKAEDNINQQNQMENATEDSINNSTDTQQATEQNQDSIGEIPMVDSDMVQRLRNEVKEDFEKKNNTNMILLDQLDEADVRHDKCPECKYQPMVRKEGFKVCPSCGNIYKMIDGRGYIIIG